MTENKQNLKKLLTTNNRLYHREKHQPFLPIIKELQAFDAQNEALQALIQQFAEELATA